MLTKIAIESDCCKGDSIDIVGMPNKAPSNLLHQVLQFDFEGLGRRLWTTVIVDVLLASSEHTGGISLGHTYRNGPSNFYDSCRWQSNNLFSWLSKTQPRETPFSGHRS